MIILSASRLNNILIIEHRENQVAHFYVPIILLYVSFHRFYKYMNRQHPKNVLEGYHQKWVNKYCKNMYVIVYLLSELIMTKPVPTKHVMIIWRKNEFYW